MNRSIFLTKQKDSKDIKKMSLNFGPQHPAAHGVLRMILQLNGEVIERSDPHIGLLHRGTEKLMENKMYIHSLPYFDRLDYCSMLVQEHAYCLAIERIVSKPQYTSTFTLVRTLYDELTRVLNHLLAIACHALDIGSMSPVFWGFEEREKIMEFYERVSGARMHAAFYRPNTINLSGLSYFLLEDITYFINNSYTALNEINSLLVFNKIWKQRLVNIGVFDKNLAKSFGLSGVLARSTGWKNDLRLNTYSTYANYYYLNINSFIGLNGDCYDRYLIRINEMVESLNIANQAISKLLTTSENIRSKQLLKYFGAPTTSPYKDMESLIEHFKYWSEGFNVSENHIYSAVESPKGEFGVILWSDGSNKPYRCKIKSPAYYNLQFLPQMVKGHLLADLVALIGTIDIVFGEVDR